MYLLCTQIQKTHTNYKQTSACIMGWKNANQRLKINTNFSYVWTYVAEMQVWDIPK